MSYRHAEYTQMPARYDPDDAAWWVNYSPKDPRNDPFSGGFNIEVQGKTGEAWLFYPDGHQIL
jgi:hypothetical protein